MSALHDYLETPKSTWAEFHRIISVKTGLVQVFANFIGAGVCYSYFALFDSSAPISLISIGLLITIVMTAGLIVIGFILNRRWQRGLSEYVRLKMAGRDVSQALEKEARRKILNFPFMAALVALINWAMASIIMSGYNFIETASMETFSAALFQGLRVFVGVAISGVITSAIVFFRSGNPGPQNLAPFFPSGKPEQNPGRPSNEAPYPHVYRFHACQLCAHDPDGDPIL